MKFFALKRRLAGLFLTAAFSATPAWVFAQASSTEVTLQQLVESTLASHPLVRGAVQEEAAARIDVDAARRHWWPTASIAMESQGRINSPATRGVQLEQTIWDGGLINANIDQARAGVGKGEARIVWQRQQLALQVVNAWQSLISARDRAQVAEHSIELLRGYEDQMRRRVAADASPSIDLELVLSRMRQAEVDLLSARTAMSTAAQRLQQLSGVPDLAARPGSLADWPDSRRIEAAAAGLLSADIETRARDSAAVKIAQGDVAITKAQLEAKSAQRWPTIYVRVNKPLGNPYPEANVSNGTTVFVGVRYTPGAGFATGLEADAIRERVSAVKQSVDAAVLEQREAIMNDIEQFSAAQRQLPALRSAVQGAQQVLDSYSRQFTAGRKTWIDLLNAVRELSQNQYAQADSRAAMSASFYRLKLRMGLFDLNLE